MFFPGDRSGKGRGSLGIIQAFGDFWGLTPSPRLCTIRFDGKGPFLVLSRSVGGLKVLIWAHHVLEASFRKGDYPRFSGHASLSLSRSFQKLPKVPVQSLSF